MSNLYQATEQLKSLEVSIEEAEGVLTEEAMGVYLQSCENFDEAVLSGAGWIKSLDGDIDITEQEIIRLRLRQASLKGRRNRFKRFMVAAMLSFNKPKIKNAIFTVSIRTNPPKVEVDDPTVLPEECFDPQPAKLVLKRVKELIESGKEFAGVRIVREQSLQIR